MNPDGPSRTNEQQDEQAAAMGGSPPPAFEGVNANAELVADLLAATGLLSEDKLNVVRGSAGQGSLAQAIVSEGYAASEGVAGCWRRASICRSSTLPSAASTRRRRAPCLSTSSSGRTQSPTSSQT